MKRRAFTLVTTTTELALAYFSSGVWQPLSELTPNGAVEIYHTVTKERFRVLITDYIHTEPK